MNMLTEKQKQVNALFQQPSLKQVPIQDHVQPILAQQFEAALAKGNASTPMLHGVLESLMDGILILTDQGQLVDANSYALQLCRYLMSNSSELRNVPPQIWQSCEALIDSRELFPGHSITIEDEICVGQSSSIRIRVRWVELDYSNRPYLLVLLEDRHQSLKNIAIAEARKYGLTSREAEVWLLRRANQTYKAIAAELHIAIDTVKKHIKSIHAKRDAVLWADES
jgi:DNA-binding CsgD family transcriptional regulator